MSSIRVAFVPVVVATFCPLAFGQPCNYAAEVLFGSQGIFSPFPVEGGGIRVDWVSGTQDRPVLASSQVWRSCAWTALLDCGSGFFGWGIDPSEDLATSESQQSSGSQLIFDGSNTASVQRQSFAGNSIDATAQSNNGSRLFFSKMSGTAWNTRTDFAPGQNQLDDAYRGGNGFSRFSATFTLGPSTSTLPTQLVLTEFLNFAGRATEVLADTGGVVGPCSQPQGIRDYLYWDDTNEIRSLNTVQVLIDGQIVYSNTFIARAVRGGTVQVESGGSPVQLSTDQLSVQTYSAGVLRGLEWQLNWEATPLSISLPASESSVVLEIRHQVEYGNRDADAFSPCTFQIPAGLTALTCPGCVPAACPADVAGIGGSPGPDGQITGDDFNAFITWFAAGDVNADITGIGEDLCPDGLVTGEDFNAFIASFAAGCP